MPGMGVPLTALEQIMRQRAKADPTAPPITAPDPMQGVDASELERWYAELMRPPTTMERIAAGVQVPNTPIVHGKSAPGRMLLRGLVGGFKGSASLDRGLTVGGERGSGLRTLQGRPRRGLGAAALLGGGGGGRYVNPEYEDARTAAMRALEQERLARMNQTNEPTPEDPLLAEKRAAWEALTGQRNAARDATRQRAGAYASRQAKLSASGGGGRGGSMAAYNAERATLKARHEAVLSRLKAAATQLWGETEGQYAKPLAIEGRSRLVNKAEQEYRRLLDELDRKYGMGVSGGDAEDEDELY